MKHTDKGVGSLKVLYFCVFLDETLSNHYGYAYSQAGLNKKRGILEALYQCGVEPVVISPLLLTAWLPHLFKRSDYTDDHTQTPVFLPSTIDFILPLNFVYLFFSTCYLLLRLRRNAPFDAIILYNWNIHLIMPALFCKLMYRTSIILEYEDGLFADNRHPIEAKMAQLLEWIFNPLLNGAILSSLNFVQRIKTSNYVVVRGIIDSDVLDRTNFEASDRSEAIIIMFSGSLDIIRGIGTFLELSLIFCGRRDVEMWITGYGTDEEIQRLKIGLEDLDCQNVKYLGFLPTDEYQRRLHQADILVNLQQTSFKLSKYTFPSKLIEFMYTGNIVVSTPVSDVDQIAEGRVIICEDDPQALGQLLKSLMENMEHYRSYGEQARAWVQKNCTPQAAGHEIRKVLTMAVYGG